MLDLLSVRRIYAAATNKQIKTIRNHNGKRFAGKLMIGSNIMGKNLDETG